MLDRRSFVATLSAATLLPRHLLAQPTLNSRRAFIGTTGGGAQGIFFAYFDAMTGTLTQPEFASKLAGNDSMTLSPHNPKRLYATCGIDGKAFAAGFDIVDGTAPLQLINQQSAEGTIANFLSLDPSGRVAMEANWGSGSINTYLVDKAGALSPVVQHIEYGDANHGPSTWQPHSRCHSILVAPGGKFVLVNDYGADRIYIYTLDETTAKLTPHDPPFWQAAAGSAPRHLLLHPNGKWIYCIFELSNTIDLLLWDAKAGTLTQQSTVSTLPADAPPNCHAADMVLSPDRRFLYSSNRTLESFVTFAVGRDGALKQVQFVPSSGAQNRQITLDATGKWFLAANVKSGDIAVYPRNPKTGMLGTQTSSTKLPGAGFVLWA
ncbi:MAG: lactonase family protein [Janthinobacterium lividum]